MKRTLLIILCILLLVSCSNTGANLEPNSMVTFEKRNTSDIDIIFNDWDNLKSESFYTVKELTLPNRNTTCSYIHSNGSGSTSLPLNMDSGNYGVYARVLGDSDSFKILMDSDEISIDPSKETFSRNRREKNIFEIFGGVLKISDNSSVDISFSTRGAKVIDIRFLPLSDRETHYFFADEEQLEKEFLFDNDMFTDFFQGENKTLDTFKENTIYQYNRIGISSLNYCVGTTFMPFYKSKIAGVPFETFAKYKHMVREGDISAYEDFTNILHSHGSPIEIVNNEKKSFDLFLSYRMNSFLPDDYRGFLNGSLYEEFNRKHQKFNYKISFYYQAYRDYLHNLILEGIENFSPAGITLDFTRTPNFFGYELINRDARKRILTQFVSDVSSSIPSDVKILVRFPYNYDDYDLDLKSWIHYGYVDYISPSSLKYEEFFDISPFVELVNDSAVSLIPSITANVSGEDLDKNSENDFLNKGLNGINNEYLYMNDYLLRAKYLYDSGSDGVLLFNVNTQLGDTESLPHKLNLLRDQNQINKWFYFEYYSKRENNCSD